MNFSLQANQFQSVKINDEVLIFESYGKKMNLGLENILECTIADCDSKASYTLKIILKNKQTLSIQVTDKIEEFKSLVSNLNEVLENRKCMPSSSINQKLLFSNENIDLIYLGGHPSIIPSQEVRVQYIDTEYISIRNIENIFQIPLNNVLSYKIVSKKEIVERVTLTRIFALGVFAFAFPKHEIDYEKYLLIEVKDKVDVLTLVFRGTAIKQVQQIIYDYKLKNHVKSD